MKITHKTALVVMFVLLAEVLYLHVDSHWVQTKGAVGRSTRLSLGLPFRSVTYTSENFTGTIKPLGNWLFKQERPVGLRVQPVLFVLDVLILFILVFLLARWFPTTALVPAIQGCVLGFAIGTLAACFAWMLSPSWISGIIALIVLFTVVPLVVYLFSLKHGRQSIVVLILACTTWATFLRVAWLMEALLEGTELSVDLGDLFYISLFMGLFVCDCLAVMLLHRKVLPVLFRKRRAKRPPGSDTG